MIKKIAGLMLGLFLFTNIAVAAEQVDYNLQIRKIERLRRVLLHQFRRSSMDEQTINQVFNIMVQMDVAELELILKQAGKAELIYKEDK